MESIPIQSLLSDYFEREMLHEAMSRSLVEEEKNTNKVNHSIRVKTNKCQSDKTETCAICLGTIRKNTNVYDLECKHHFHIRCLDKWVKRRQECPICRNSITCEERRKV